LPECKIAKQSEECRRQSSRDQQVIVILPKPAKNIHSEPAGPDSRSHGRDADRDHDRHANPRKDDRHRERQLDQLKPLPVGHAHSCRRFAKLWIDPEYSCDSVADNGQQGIECKSYDGRPSTDPADKWNGNQQSEKSQARNRLHYIGKAENGRLQ
jgi:hypothetical protein